jgi:lipoprotein-anchoring transpeptidase ErfK/SrfK
MAVYRARLAVVVAAVTLLTIAAGCTTAASSAGSHGTTAGGGHGTSTSPGSGSITTTLPTTTLPPTTTTTQPAGPELGMSGSEVLAVQQRLQSLGYWVGTPDGTFGDATQQAVYALQKAAGIGRDGVVGPITQAALDQGVVPHPRSSSGYVVEVDLEHELVMLVKDGALEDVLNTSTGGGYTYTSDGVTAVADTPTGQFQIFREVDGMVTDSLGQLWRPKFFDSGFAIHGDSYVPPYPVSHGCVRVSNEAIDWIWSQDLMPIGTSVWVY